MTKPNERIILSVIVPIYKVEAYIHQCIDSLVNQTAENIEIILVDDGSPDRCPAICDAYAERYAHVQVIHKKNGGLVSARKCGALHAHGEYITFVDGDDWVAEDYFAALLSAAELYHPDAVCLTSFFRSSGDMDADKVTTEVFKGLYHRKKLETEVFPQLLYQPPFFRFGITPSLWSKAIKRELLLRVLPNEPEDIRMGEDLAVTIPCMLAADSVYFLDICGYYYRQNPTSITHSFDISAPVRVDILLNTLRKETEQYEAYQLERQIAFYAMHITEFIVTSLIVSSVHMRRDLKHFQILWDNSAVKQGLKMTIPFKTKIILYAAKYKQLWLLKLLQIYWLKQKQEGYHG